MSWSLLLWQEYGLDTNWLRVWLHNGNNAPTEAAPRVDNPDLILKSRNATALHEMMGNALGQVLSHAPPAPVVVFALRGRCRRLVVVFALRGRCRRLHDNILNALIYVCM